MHTFTVDLHSLSFTFSLLAFLWTQVEAEPKVYGSFQPIIAAPGDDVILPCHVQPPINVKGLTVEWSKPDLKTYHSDLLSHEGYVHLYQNRREVLDMKLQSYVNRTEMFTDELKYGNISLKITNVTHADAGRYRCFIPKLTSHVKDSIVHLVVRHHSWYSLIPVLFFFIMVFLGGGVWFLNKIQLLIKRCLTKFTAEPNNG